MSSGRPVAVLFPEDNQLWRQTIPKEKYETEIMALLAGRAA